MPMLCMLYAPARYSERSVLLGGGGPLRPTQALCDEARLTTRLARGPWPELTIRV